MEPDNNLATDFWLNDCKVMPDRKVVVRGDVNISINPRSMALLLLLVERHGEVVDGEYLLERAWPANHIGSNTIYRAVNELRTAFDDSSAIHTYIETIPRKGYRLIAEVSFESRQSLHKRKLIQRVGGVALASVVILAIAVVLSWNETVTVTIASIDEKRVAFIPPDEDSDGGAELAYQETLMKIIENYQGSLEIMDVPIEHIDSGSIIEHHALDQLVEFKGLENGLVVGLRPALSGYAHVDSYGPGTSTTTIVEHTLADLETVLDDQHQKQMQTWGTADLHAYQQVRDGNRFALRMDRKSLHRSVRLFREAIDSDPKFAGAYHLLAMSYSWLAATTLNTEGREQVRDNLQQLIEQARYEGIEDEMILDLETHLNAASASHPLQLANQYLDSLTSNPQDGPALQGYAVLLAGAGLADEARGYLDMAISLVDDPDLIALMQSDYTTIVAGSDNSDLVEVNRLALITLAQRPNHVIVLNGLVVRNAILGNYKEAEHYLERLRQADADGFWAHSAWMRFAARRGDLPLGSEALEKAVNDPKASDIAAGLVYLTLGDVAKGLARWRKIQAGVLPLLWRFKSIIETSFPRSVLDDYRYQSLMDDYGVGLHWRYFLLQKTEQLADITGIPRTTFMEPPELQMIARFDSHGVPVALN